VGGEHSTAHKRQRWAVMPKVKKEYLRHNFWSSRVPFLPTTLYAWLCPFPGGWKFINVRLDVTILTVVRILISEWKQREYIKTGVDYTKFSETIVSIVLAYLRINIYANFKLMHHSPCTYTSVYNLSIRNQHFPPKPWFITNLFFLSRVFVTWDHHQGYHRKFEVEITNM